MRLRGGFPYLIATLLSAALPSAACGAETRGRALSLAEVRAMSERRAPDVLLAGDRVDVSRADVGVAGALQNPTFSLRTMTKTARLGTELSVPLPLFGQRGVAVDAARADLEASRWEVPVAKSEARWNATLAWIDLWEAEGRVRILGISLTEAARVVSIAEERFDAGAVPRVDVVRAGADLARARADAASAESVALASSARLLPWIGESGRSVVHAAGDPDYPRGLPALAELASRLDAHPALSRDRARVAAAAAHVRAEERQRWPMVSALVGMNQFDPTIPGTEFVFGVALDLPILNQRGGAIARARAVEGVSNREFLTDARFLDTSLGDAWNRAAGAAARMESLETAVLPAMEEARRMTEEAYRDGRVDVLRLVDAQRGLLESRVARVEAEATWARALADIERATGVPLAPESTRAP